jgi:hypothetical protein
MLILLRLGKLSRACLNNFLGRNSILHNKIMYRTGGLGYEKKKIETEIKKIENSC